jgi:hypothetical protein
MLLGSRIIFLVFYTYKIRMSEDLKKYDLEIENVDFLSRSLLPNYHFTKGVYGSEFYKER